MGFKGGRLVFFIFEDIKSMDKVIDEKRVDLLI